MGSLGPGRQYGSQCSSVHSGSRSQECRWYSSSSNPASQIVLLYSLLKGQCSVRSFMAWVSSFEGSEVAVWMGIETVSVGKTQVVVMLTEFVRLSGAGSQVYVSGGVVVVGGGVVEGITGVNVLVWPGGPMQMYFPTIVCRFAHERPMVGFHDCSIRSVTLDPASARRDEHVSEEATS